MYRWDTFLILAPLFMLLSFFLWGIFAWNKWAILLGISFFIFGLVGNLGLKHLAALLSSRKIISPELLYRPSICPLPFNNTCESCSLIPSWQPKSLKGEHLLGYPSGHVQSMWMVAVFWTLRSSGIKSEAHRIMSTAIFWSWTIMVSMQRYDSKCHSFHQVFAGACVGTLLGIITHYIFPQNIFK